MPMKGVREFGRWKKGENQGDWTMNVDGRGLLEGNFKKAYPTWDAGESLAPQKGDVHPLNNKMTCYKSSVQYGHMGQVFVTAEYIGIAKDPTEGEWEISSSTTSESVVFHPSFPDLAIDYMYGGEGTGDGSEEPWAFKDKIVDKDPSNPKIFQRFNCVDAPADLRGVESYLTPRATMKVSFYTAKKGMIAEITGNIGKTSATPMYAPADVCPQTGGNWLLTGASVSEYGNIYKIQTEWMASDHGGPWSESLYTAYSAQSKQRSSKGSGLNGPANNVPFGNTVRGTAPYSG